MRILKEQSLLDQRWFNLAIFKPDIDLVAGTTTEERDELRKAEIQRTKNIQSPIQIHTDQELDRLTSRQFYGKWYLPPEQWSHQQKEAIDQQVLDELERMKENKTTPGVRSPQSEIPQLLGSPVESQQHDWNRQFKFAIKRTIQQKESILTKLLAQMQDDKITNKEREEFQKQFAKKLREKSSQLLDSSYLSQVIRFVPGVAEAYFYELRRVVEHQSESRIDFQNKQSSGGLGASRELEETINQLLDSQRRDVQSHLAEES